MPICPRCGKTLSTYQALEYHLKKKNKCGSIKCKICDKTFETKLALQMHCLECEGSSQLNYDEGLKVCHSILLYRKRDDIIDWKSKALINKGMDDDEVLSKSKQLVDNIYVLSN